MPRLQNAVDRIIRALPQVVATTSLKGKKKQPRKTTRRAGRDDERRRSHFPLDPIPLQSNGWDWTAENDILGELGGGWRTTTRIPNKAKGLFNDALCVILTKFRTNGNLASKVLRAVPAWILRCDRAGQRGQAERKMIYNLRRFRNNEWAALHSDAIAHKPKHCSTDTDNSDTIRISKALALMQNGYPGKAGKCLDGLPKAVGNDDTIDKLQKLHPDKEICRCRHCDHLAYDDDDVIQHALDSGKHIHLEEDDVVQSIKRGKPECAPDFYGWRPYQLRPLVDRPDLLSLLTDLGNIYTKAELDGETASSQSGARLAVLTKENLKPRPIAIGDTFRRIFGRFIAASTKDYWKRELFQPESRIFQYAVGIPSGSQVYHTSVQMELDADPNMGAMDCDATTNGYNSMFRSHFLKSCARRKTTESAGKLRYAHQFYRYKGVLYFRREDGTWAELISSTGSHQGCTIGGLVFAIGMHDIVATIMDQFPEIKSAHMFVDNITFVAHPLVLMRAATFISREFGHAGLHIRYMKVFPGRLQPTAWTEVIPESLSDVVEVHMDGLRVMGAPVGTDAFRREFIHDRFLNYRKRSNLLTPLGIQDPQSAY